MPVRAINNRLSKLETAVSSDDGLMVGEVMLDGTRAEVEARRAALLAGGERLLIRVVVPHIGETTNEYRQSIGLAPLDIGGWDTPREREEGKPVASIRRFDQSAMLRYYTGEWEPMLGGE